MLLYCVIRRVSRLRKHGDGGSDAPGYSTPERTRAFDHQHQHDLVRHRDLPIAGIPPVRVEVPIGEAGNLSKRSQNILEDDEETDEESHHEREQ